jgi:hypothetical protein
MRKLITTCAMFGALSGVALAETFSGTLLDANCLQRHHATRSCDAKPSTMAFVLDSNGTRYRLDGRSNDAAHSAMRSRADKAWNPDATKAVPVQATITGHIRRNGKIRADVVGVQ